MTDFFSPTIIFFSFPISIMPGGAGLTGGELYYVKEDYSRHAPIS